MYRFLLILLACLTFESCTALQLDCDDSSEGDFEYEEYEDLQQSEDECLEKLEEQEYCADFYAGVRKVQARTPEPRQYIYKQISTYRDMIEQGKSLEFYNKEIAHKRMAELKEVMSNHIKKDLLTELAQSAARLHARVGIPDLALARQEFYILLHDPTGLTAYTLKQCNAPELLKIHTTFKQYAVALEESLKKRARFLERNGTKGGESMIAQVCGFYGESMQYEWDVWMLHNNGLLPYKTPKNFAPERYQFSYLYERLERCSDLPDVYEYTTACEVSDHMVAAWDDLTRLGFAKRARTSL